MKVLSKSVLGCMGTLYTGKRVAKVCAPRNIWVPLRMCFGLILNGCVFVFKALIINWSYLWLCVCLLLFCFCLNRKLTLAQVCSASVGHSFKP